MFIDDYEKTKKKVTQQCFGSFKPRFYGVLLKVMRK